MGEISTSWCPPHGLTRTPLGDHKGFQNQGQREHGGPKQGFKKKAPEFFPKGQEKHTEDTNRGAPTGNPWGNLQHCGVHLVNSNFREHRDFQNRGKAQGPKRGPKKEGPFQFRHKGEENTNGGNTRGTHTGGPKGTFGEHYILGVQPRAREQLRGPRVSKHEGRSSVHNKGAHKKGRPK